MLLCIMNVYITGGNKSLRELAHSLVDYCADKMFSENLRNKLVLDIEFSKTLYKEDGILGEIDFEDSNLSLIHISEPTRPRLISYAVFCLKKKK